MPTQQEQNTKLDIRTGEEDEEAARARVTTMNLGGEGSVAGAPVVISSGVLANDSLEHDRLLRENPPIASVPAQDPTPLREYTEGEVPVGTVREIPAQGGPSSVRRVDDRTPGTAYDAAGEPYNADASAAQVSKRTGRDTTEEVAEGKYTEEGVQGFVAAQAEEEQAAADDAAASNAADTGSATTSRRART